MKKTLVRLASPAPTAPAPRRKLGTRLVGSLGLLAVLGAAGLFASSRPAHTAGGPIPVNVANAPLATTPTDVAAPSQPFQASTDFIIPDGSFNGNLDTVDGFTAITVPAGKRLVIQAVSLGRGGASNGESVQALINTTVKGDSEHFPLLPVPSNGSSYSGLTQAVTLYTDGGNPIPITLFRSGSSGTESDEVTVSGYLVNAT